jgi:NTE family protein
VAANPAKQPDVLVLGAGGILGEAWTMAVLAGLEDASEIDATACEGYVGTSAGSIVAAVLAAGVRPRRRLGELPEQPAVDGPDAARGVPAALTRALRLGSVAAAPFASVALRSTAWSGALVRRAALARVPAGGRSLADLGRTMERAGTRWDGRLRIAAVEVESGRRVIIDGESPPRMTVPLAVQASCAIPGVFRPIEVDGRTYVDGGAWSPTNMDAADVSRGARVLCLNPTGAIGPAPTPAGAIGAFSRSMAAIEALALRRRGARVTTVAPDAGSLAAMGANLMDATPRDDVIRAGVEQGRRIAAG